MGGHRAGCHIGAMPHRATMLGRTSRVLFALSRRTLLWLILFKLSYDISSVLAGYKTRSLNLVPFVSLGQTGLSETVSNVVSFIPFGLLAALNFKHTALWRLLAAVITNPLGGLVGLVLYRLVNRVVRAEVLDWLIVAVGLALFVALLLLRLL